MMIHKVLSLTQMMSSLNRTGSFAIQSFNINGVQRILPTLGIFSETKKSLAESIQTTLEILSVATGCMYIY